MTNGSVPVFVYFTPFIAASSGYALDTKVEHVPTVVLNLDGKRDSQLLLEQFRNTRSFRIVDSVQDFESFQRALDSGFAKAGLIIPADYAERLLNREDATIGLVIDGTDSTTANTALAAAKQLGTRVSMDRARRIGESLQIAPARDREGRSTLPIEVRPRLLYNPDLLSERFFVPGLVGVILMLVTLFLTSMSIVRERELGTLEQLFVTPVGRVGLVLGKLLPYSVIGMAAAVLSLNVMVFIFSVPIRGNIFLLLMLSFLFLICALAMGLLISTAAQNQVQALQMSLLVMMPSILLSGFVFPRDNMPALIYWITYIFPVTYFVEIMRGIVLRGADLMDLRFWVIGLAGCTTVILGLSLTRFRKVLD